MSAKHISADHLHVEFSKEPHQQEAPFYSSDPQQNPQPVDYVLVYTQQDTDYGPKKPNVLSRWELRQLFESYLSENEGLILRSIGPSADKTCCVKIHTPLDVLFSIAEKIRMKLPIELVKKDDNDAAVQKESRWSSFIRRCKQPFYLDEALVGEDLDYYTAIYSSKVEKFNILLQQFEKMNRTYFTPSDRSLLTYELLSRSHGDENLERNDDDDDDDDDFDYDDDRGMDNNQTRENQLNLRALVTMDALRQRSRRPGLTYHWLERLLFVKRVLIRLVRLHLVLMELDEFRIGRLIRKKVYDDFFPLHEPLRDNTEKFDDRVLNDREKLRKHWATMRKWFKFQPIGLIRSYMGEKVAFYFAFVGFYNMMLIPAAIVGLIIFIYGAASISTDDSSNEICGNFGNNTYMCPKCDKICPFWKLSDSCLNSRISHVFDNGSTIVFAILISLWARWFVGLWKRRESTLRYEWDSIDFDEILEPVLSSYEHHLHKNKQECKERINPITKKKERYIPYSKRIPFYLLSVLVVFLTIAIVIGVLFSTIVYRVQMDRILKSTSAKSSSAIIITITSATMNLICTLLLSLGYYWVAQKMTNLEIHKYKSTYDDSLALKIYLFQFVNFYSSVFYIAFFKGRFDDYPSTYGTQSPSDFPEQCDPSGCFFELTIQVIVFMIGNQIVNLIVELVLAVRRSCGCSRAETAAEREQWEIDKGLLNIDEMALINEYIELVIQYGFVTLFAVAFPLAPLFALLNNIFELRLDAWKFLSKYKRPVPQKASDIGIWNDILSAVSYIAVLTNAVIIAWTSDFIPAVTYRTLRQTGSGLNGFVDWTLSYFPISDYNRTGLMPPDVPSGLTYCRYRDFRDSTGPSYSHTSMYWNVLAARLAFIVVFENLVYFSVYLVQILVPDVPKPIQDKIAHERYIDQCERWASKDDKRFSLNRSQARRLPD